MDTPPSPESDVVQIEMQWDTQDCDRVQCTETNVYEDLDQLRIKEEKGVLNEHQEKTMASTSLTSLADSTAGECDDKESREVIEIDPRGDVALRTGTKDLLVSSKILSIASTVFDDMLNDSTTMGPGNYSHKRGLLILRLQHDDPEALSLLCHLLHHKLDACMPRPNLGLLLRLVEISRKYKCLPSIQVQGSYWLRCATECTWMNHENIKKALETAYLLGGDEAFRAIYKRCAGVLDAAGLQNMLMESNLPTKLIVESISMRNKVFQSYLYAIEDAFSELQERPNPPGRFCSNCLSIKFQEAKTKVCHSCRCRDLEPVSCTAESRVATFLDILVSCGLWPMAANMHDSILAISSRIRDEIDELHGRGMHMHDCEYEADCPLHTVLSILVKDLRKAERDSKVQEDSWGDIW